MLKELSEVSFVVAVFLTVFFVAFVLPLWVLSWFTPEKCLTPGAYFSDTDVYVLSCDLFAPTDGDHAVNERFGAKARP